MTYFTKEDGQHLQAGTLDDLLLRMDALHKKIAAALKARDYDLHVYSDDDKAHIHAASVSSHKPGKMLTLQYMRPKQQAITVERLMGRDDVVASGQIDPCRHPVIELRLSPTHLALELVLSPDAWWDQQNLMGKLTVARHRNRFFDVVKTADEARLGYWQGIELDDEHVEGERFQYGGVLPQWLSTFAPGKDWFRLGVWYALDYSPTEAEIHDELIMQVSRLYPVYQELLWHGGNNFREFYKAGA